MAVLVVELVVGLALELSHVLVPALSLVLVLQLAQWLPPLLLMELLIELLIELLPMCQAPLQLAIAAHHLAEVFACARMTASEPLAVVAAGSWMRQADALSRPGGHRGHC